MPLVPVNDASINCYVDDFLWPWEEGPPVLMHHGFARNAQFWNPWVRGLVGDYRIYRPEVRGCGASPAPAPGFNFTAEQLAADIIAVLDYFQLERVNWIGEHSGTLIGLFIAQMAPERIRSLVLCDAPTQTPSKTTNALGEASNADALLKYGVGRWSRDTLDHRLDTTRASQQLQDWYVEQMDRTPREVGASLTNCFHDIRVKNLIDFEEISTPVLLLSGDGSRFGTLDANKAMAERLPNCDLRVFAGYAEGINVVAAPQCVEETRLFWQRLDG